MSGKIVYCPVCEDYVRLTRKKFDHIYHEVLVFLILTGIGAIIYLILKYSKPKNTCPNCERRFDLDALRDTGKREPQTGDVIYKIA
ncbi:MAG: hypothetical protein ACOC4M_06835 [Promethearchaeia archaeon]